jgi:hypothetical protein
MGYDNHFTGEITITPPLTWAEIQTSPPLQDTHLRLVETVTDSETGRTITTQAISVVAESGFSGFRVVEEIQALVEHHGATHGFGGHIEVQFETGLVEAGEPGCERYVVRDGRVETVTPRLVWPGEATDYPGAPGTRWHDSECDNWILAADGRMWLVTETEEPADPEELRERFGPMARKGGA